ncbi:MAG: phosphate ABC transporter permease PstA [Bacillaceae bacterium]|nr:phosphate ABC transporter permease PstA [Bacillaceae bacterium]
MTSQSLSARKVKNVTMIGLTVIGTILALIPLFSIFAYVIARGMPAINIDFFTELPKPLGEEGGGMVNAIVGTLIVVGISGLIGIPVGIMSGIFLSEYGRNRFGRFISFLTDVLLGVPSIVVGIFVYVLLVLAMGGFSAYAGGIALSILMIPAVTRTTEEMLKLIPSHIREAGLALGLPKWRVILFIVLPSATRGIVTGVMLAIARVMGETAPLLFTAFGNRYWHSSLSDPIATLPVQIFTYAISPYKEWQAQAWAGALTLIVIVLIFNILARVITYRKNH